MLHNFTEKKLRRHCQKDIQLPAVIGMANTALAVKEVEPVIPTPRPGIMKIRLHSGKELVVIALRLYNEVAVARLNKKKAEAYKLLGGVSTGLIPIGSLTTVIEASIAIGIVECLLSAAAASAGKQSIMEALDMERKLRASGQFCQVGEIQNIELPIPAMWRFPYKKTVQVVKAGLFSDGIENQIHPAARIHNGDEFIIGTTQEGSTCSFRWSSVDHYVFEWND